MRDVPGPRAGAGGLLSHTSEGLPQLQGSHGRVRRGGAGPKASGSTPSTGQSAHRLLRFEFQPHEGKVLPQIKVLPNLGNTTARTWLHPVFTHHSMVGNSFWLPKMSFHPSLVPYFPPSLLSFRDNPLPFVTFPRFLGKCVRMRACADACVCGCACVYTVKFPSSY